MPIDANGNYYSGLTGFTNPDQRGNLLRQNYVTDNARTLEALGMRNTEFKNLLIDQFGFSDSEAASWAQNPTLFNVYLSGVADKLGPDALGARVYRQISRTLGGAGGGGDTGPSKAQQAVNIAATMTDISRILGMPPRDWSSFANQAAQNNWTADVIRDIVADQLDISVAQNAGFVNDVMTETRKNANDFYVTISEEEAFGWAKAAARNEMDTTSIKNEIARRAKAKFSWLAPQIDSGISVREYFRPHRELIGSLLEKSPDQIDFMNDMRWWPVIRQGENAANNGAPKDMSLTETARYVRNLDDWKTTKNAAAEVNKSVISIGKTFGVM
jgi:hypothetical protein